MLFPLTTLESFRYDYIQELANTQSYSAYQKIYNEKFKQILYNNLSARYQIHSLDYVDLVMEKYYGHSKIQGKSSCYIHLETLSLLAKSFVCHRNGRLALKYWESENDESFIGPYKGINKIALWNAMNRMMCIDVIVISYLLDNGMEEERYLNGFYSSIMLEDSQLEKILMKGVAETHIHKKAGIHFNISWQALMNLSIDSEKHYSEMYLNNPILGKEDLQNIVASAALTRLLLVQFLGLIRNSEYSLSLYEHFSTLEEEMKLAITIVTEFAYGNAPDKKTMKLYEFRDVWDEAKGQFHFSMEGKDDYVGAFIQEADYLQTSGENIFLLNAMKYIRNGKEDVLFQKLFFQYIKVKNVVFEAKVQENSIKGLKYFQPFYKRSTVIQGYDSKSYWKVLMNSQFQNRHLRKLEFRFAFDDKKNSLKNILKSFFGAYKEFLEGWTQTQEQQRTDVKPPLIGLVFHMIKQLDEGWYEKCWRNTFDLEDEKDRQKALFYSENQQYYKKQIEILLTLRKEIPYLDRFLIGIDAASIEDSTEPWVFAPIYQMARNSKDGSIQYETGYPMQTLGFTFHVGEDFRHILTGLRHVDEVLEHFSYHAGDRIGHGIVLGVDVAYWCEQNPIVMIPRGEYLDDLLWLWGIYKEERGLKHIDISYLEQKIMQIAEKIFLSIDGITVYMLWEMYQQKFHEFQPKQKFNSEVWKCTDQEIFCPYIPEKCKEYGKQWSTESLFYVQHCKRYAKPLLEPIQVEVDEKNIELFSFLQNMIIEKISSRGIVIETNPTSNLAIGEMKDLFHHYLFQLNDVTSQEKNHSAMISINSDDPSVFNTNVSNEIAYIFYALQKKGYSREEALNWIDKIRNYGMQSSFLMDSGVTLENLYKQIDVILAKLNE